MTTPATTLRIITRSASSALCEAPHKAEFERSLIRERTQAGLAAARRAGRTGGRPPKLTDDDIEAAKALLANPDIGVTQIAYRLGVSPATLYRYIPAARTANTQAFDNGRSIPKTGRSRRVSACRSGGGSAPIADVHLVSASAQCTHRIKVDFLRQAAEPVQAAVFEGEPRTGDQIAHGSRDESLAGAGDCCNPRRDVNGDAADLFASVVYLADMDAAAH